MELLKAEDLKYLSFTNILAARSMGIKKVWLMAVTDAFFHVHFFIKVQEGPGKMAKTSPHLFDLNAAIWGFNRALQNLDAGNWEAGSPQGVGAPFPPDNIRDVEKYSEKRPLGTLKEPHHKRKHKLL